MTTDLELEPQGEDAPSEEAPVSEAVNDSKPLSRDVVSKIVERERLKAFENGKREALMQMQQDQQAQQQPEQQAQAPAQMQPQGQTAMGGMSQMSPADIQKMIAEQAPQALQAHVQQLQQDHMVYTFVEKMQLAEQKYPGMEAELNKLNYNDPRMSAFIKLTNAMDNTGDIMKEALDNPTKMESLLNMAYNQPHLAQKAIASLGQSIKQNQEAVASEAQARDPMSQIKAHDPA